MIYSMKKLLLFCCLFLWSCQSAPTESEPGTWQVVRESSADVHYSALHFADQYNGWAVGDSGTILHTNNGGYSWEYQHSGTTDDLWDVHFIDRQTGWAAGEDNTLLCTGDGGKSWQLQTVECDTSIYFSAIYFADEQTGWSTDAQGRILGTVDGGATWDVQARWEIGGHAILLFVNRNVGYVMPIIGKVFLKTTDGGKHWSSTSIQELRWQTDLCFIDEENGWISNSKLASSLGGDYANVFGTTDGGITWTCLDTLTEMLHLNSIFFVDDRVGWTAGWHYIFHTTDGGHTWNHQFEQDNLFFQDVFFLDAEHGWALDYQGAICMYTVP